MRRIELNRELRRAILRGWYGFGRRPGIGVESRA
jgi:hypothetical protein